MPQPDLLLITGIPGTGKTWYGDKFAEEFGFVHYDFEDQPTLNSLPADPAQLVASMVGQKEKVVITWGFVPDDQPSVSVLRQLRNASFRLIWFDGNRDAAKQKYEEKSKRAAKSLVDFYSRMCAFYVQMLKIENTKIVDQLKPTIINPFDDRGQFKPAADLLREIVSR